MGFMSPCLNCTERQVGCHGSCDKYMDFKNKVNKQNEKKRSEQEFFFGYEREKRIKLNKIVRGKKGKN